MRLRLLNRDDDVIRVQAVGRLARDAWSDSPDPLVELLGPDVFRHAVLVDLAGSLQLDSSGLEWLLDAHKQFRVAGGVLVLHSANSLVKQMLKFLRLEETVPVALSESAALLLVRQHRAANAGGPAATSADPE